MKRKQVVATVTATALCALAALMPFTFSGRSLAQPAEIHRPNIIFIVADDLGYGDITSYNVQGVPTPFIDSLGKTGTRFTDAHVSAAVCAPSRAGLSTGRSGVRHGSEFNRGSGVRVEEKMLAEILKDAGYATGAVGKWHMGDKGGRDPLHQGFDEFFGFYFATNLFIAVDDPQAISGLGTDNEYDPQTGTRPDFVIRRNAKGEEEKFVTSIIRGDKPVEEKQYLTEAFTREALDFIDRHKDKPFFLYLAHSAPHEPYQTTKKYYERFPHIANKDRRIHASMISALDDGVGAVLDKLKAEGLDKDTIVVFLSDNGCPFYFEGNCSNGGFAGWKSYHLEGGHRVPLLISWPEQIPAGRIYEKPVSALDLYPTFAALAGAELSANVSLDGVNLMPYLKGAKTTAPHSEFYWRAGANFAMRDGRWKLVVINKTTPAAFGDLQKGEAGAKSKRPPFDGISPHGQYVMLYDLKSDPGEKNNLAVKMPGKVEALRNKFDAWNKSNPPSNVKEATGNPVRLDAETVELAF